MIGGNHDECFDVRHHFRLQAESIETLRAFGASPDLAQVMQAAGVIGKPDLTFAQGSEWAS